MAEALLGGVRGPARRSGTKCMAKNTSFHTAINHREPVAAGTVASGTMHSCSPLVVLSTDLPNPSSLKCQGSHLRW